MNFDRDLSETDDYFNTAKQIFYSCGVESSGSLRIDALMDKFAPFLNTDKADFSCLKTLLDSEENNSDINVTKLANALHKFSETHKTKLDLDESFNLKVGHGPQDSDSGISTEGQIEELQCELKAKDHLVHQLRKQLDFTYHQQEETVAALTAEKDSLLQHINMVRDENAILSRTRVDFDEASERLCASETELARAKKDLDSLRKQAKGYEEQIDRLESDKQTLQELLSKSKDECHRINEMYAGRQSALLEENETFKNENAELTSRFQDQELYMQQILKEKVILEMELKDILNKSNKTHFGLDRSIDVSYNEDPVLTALDSLITERNFGPDQSSISTQVEMPCSECEKHKAVTPYRNLRRFFWEPLKSLFQVFAVICFLVAVVVLSGVTRSPAGECRAAPWRWVHVQELMDLLFRIEYTAEVPM